MPETSIGPAKGASADVVSKTWRSTVLPTFVVLMFHHPVQGEASSKIAASDSRITL